MFTNLVFVFAYGSCYLQAKFQSKFFKCKFRGVFKSQWINAGLLKVFYYSCASSH